MSEYMYTQKKSPASIEELDNTGTLFETELMPVDGDHPDTDHIKTHTAVPDDDKLDKLVDKGITYDDARRYLGLDTPEVEPISHEKPPIVVDIDERAVALSAVMNYLNKANQVHGSAVQLDNGGGAVKEHYGSIGSAVDVHRGAERKRNKLLIAYNNGLNTLIAADALQQNGYSYEEIENERQNMRHSINEQFGVGNAYASDRKKVVTVANRTATKVLGKQKAQQ